MTRALSRRLDALERSAFLAPIDIAEPVAAPARLVVFDVDAGPPPDRDGFGGVVFYIPHNGREPMPAPLDIDARA